MAIATLKSRRLRYAVARSRRLAPSGPLQGSSVRKVPTVEPAGPASQSEATRFEGVATLGGPPRPFERVGGRHNFTARADIQGSAR